MSQAIIRTPAPFTACHDTIGLWAGLNRVVLDWLARLEDAAQRRRDRHILATMSDGELADIGIGRGEIDHIVP